MFKQPPLDRSANPITNVAIQPGQVDDCDLGMVAKPVAGGQMSRAMYIAS